LKAFEHDPRAGVPREIPPHTRPFSDVSGKGQTARASGWREPAVFSGVAFGVELGEEKKQGVDGLTPGISFVNF
jgi:hypothetical protein